MANRWRDEDFSRYSDKEIRRFRDGYAPAYSSSYGADRARIDANYRDVAAYERDMVHDDPDPGPIDRMRNWMNHRGKGPKGYVRSDERIREDVSDHLTQDDLVDASNIEVVVVDCECTLNGSVATRGEKRRAEDLAERIMGVKHVQNNLRVAPTATSPLSTQDREGTMSTTIGANPTLSAVRNNNSY